MVTVVTLVDSAVGYGRCETEEHNKMKMHADASEIDGFPKKKASTY